ncbi:MAG: glycosyltransferase [Candidatus Krumholzibacteria bacterium]|nr:glycosyltransferase [Candidatus Krumholzibacteria bacterium]
MKSRNILFFISSLRIGGAELHLLNLCGYLAGRGVSSSVCTLAEGGDLRTRFEELGVTVHDLRIGSLTDLVQPSVRKRIGEIVAASDPDIIHAHMYHAEIAAALASARSGVPLVVTRHSSGLEFNGFRKFAASVAGKWMRRVIAVSEEAAEEAAKIGASPDAVVTIPNGVDTSRFRPLDPALRESERARLIDEQFTAGCAAECVLIGSVSGLKPVKNFPMLVTAFSHLEGPRLLVLGEGPSRGELEGLISELGLEGKVSLPGHSARPEEYLPLLDLFVLPSRSEGVPMALLEAMSCGLACAASRVGGIPDLLGDCGITFDSGDTEGLVDLLGQLAADPALRADLGRRARIRAMEYFDLEIWGTRTMAVYEDVVDSHGRR